MKRLLSVIFISCVCLVSNAQSFVVKTNTLYWCTATPNLGLEGAVSPRWTVGVKGGYNPWVLNKENNRKAKHFLVSPQARYWFCEAFHGHFIGVHVNYTHFNVGSYGVPALFYNVQSSGIMIDHLKNFRSEGRAIAAGMEYGCSWPIARCWNVELNIGLGIWYAMYDKYESRNCGLFNESFNKAAFGPTSLGFSFVYIIK